MKYASARNLLPPFPNNVGEEFANCIWLDHDIAHSAIGYNRMRAGFGLLFGGEGPISELHLSGLVATT